MILRIQEKLVKIIFCHFMQNTHNVTAFILSESLNDLSLQHILNGSDMQIIPNLLFRLIYNTCYVSPMHINKEQFSNMAARLYPLREHLEPHSADICSGLAG